MKLTEDAAYLAGAVTANVVVPDRIFWSEAVHTAVDEFRRNRDRAAAVEFSAATNLVALFRRLDAWRKAHRKVHRPADPDCSCQTVQFGWLGIVEDHVDSVFGWADLTDEERDRQIEWLRGAARKHLSKASLRTHAVRLLRGLPAPDPDELLITSLASAPGAPPAPPCLLLEGYLAA